MDHIISQNQGGPIGPSPFNPILSGNYAQDFMEAMRRAGIDFKDNIIPDGVIHRFPTKNPRKDSGWYVFYGMAGHFGDWSRDFREGWSLRNSSLPREDQELIREQNKMAQETAKEERNRKHEETS